MNGMVRLCNNLYSLTEFVNTEDAQYFCGHLETVFCWLQPARIDTSAFTSYTVDCDSYRSLLSLRKFHVKDEVCKKWIVNVCG